MKSIHCSCAWKFCNDLSHLFLNPHFSFHLSLHSCFHTMFVLAALSANIGRARHISSISSLDVARYDNMFAKQSSDNNDNPACDNPPPSKNSFIGYTLGEGRRCRCPGLIFNRVVTFCAGNDMYLFLRTYQGRKYPD